MGRADGKNPHVLVVEDDVSIVEFYREVLEDEGYGVTVATSPDLEPTAVASRNPNLVLLDLRFGHDACGVAWLGRLKACPETRSVPVLVCSADHRLLGSLHDQLLDWECGVLPKPFDLEEFLAAIHAGVAPHVRCSALDALHAATGSSGTRHA